MSRAIRRKHQRLWAQVFSGAASKNLFREGEQGAYYNPSDLSTLYTDSALTTNVSDPGDPVGGMQDLSGNDNHATQATDADRPIYGITPATGRRNELDSTDSLATQDVEVTNEQRTLSFVGSGSITLSGAHSETLNGVDGSTRVSTTFTPSAGTLTVTVSGTVEKGQLELGDSVTNYQSVVSEFEVTEAGVRSLHYAHFNGTNQFSETSFTAATYTVAIAGTEGSWIEEVDHPGGTFQIGVTTYTGGPDGLLDVLGDVLDIVVVEGSITTAQRERLVSYFKLLGSPGVFELGPELVTNGTFDSDLSGWTNDGNWVWDSSDGGRAYHPANDEFLVLRSNSIASAQGSLVITQWDSEVISDQMRAQYRTANNNPAGGSQSYPGPIGGHGTGSFSYVNTVPTDAESLGFARDNTGQAMEGYIDNVSVRKLELVT